MSGDVRYPGWCCRQIAAQLSQALFTVADLHAQVSDLREENRQLKIKIESIAIKRPKEDALPAETPMELAAALVSSPSPLAIRSSEEGVKTSEGELSQPPHQYGLKSLQKFNQDIVQSACYSDDAEPNSESKPERIVLNVPFNHIPGKMNGESSHSAFSQTSGEFKCDKCDCSFPNSDLLTIHQAVHIGRSFHVCKICNAMFLLKADLYRHWATHPNIKQHVCQLCGKAYTSKNNYKLHIKTHTGLGLYPCEVCGKAFHSENHLNVHRRIHTGERPYECQYCEKSFTQKSGLINHTRLHTGEKPFLCPSCPKAFTQKSNLNFHLSKHHPLS